MHFVVAHSLNGLSGKDMKSPGDPVGVGLSQQAANETGLIAQLPVATSIIDAHAGGLGK